jgi:DNA-binding GntR family transcriptional regulator
MTLQKNLSVVALQRTRQSAPQVFEALRTAIIAVDLKPGTVLNRTELAAHYGVSQTPIRDALQRLSEEGLVDVYAQHATKVSRIDAEGVLQLHFMRKALEIEILKTLCALPAIALNELLDRLRMNLKEQKKSLIPLSSERLAGLDLAFHQLLYEAANVGPLWTLLRQKSGDVDRLRRLNLPKKGKAKSVVKDHEAILHALEKKDASLAEDALRKHLAGTLAFVAEIKTLYPNYILV